MFKLLSAAFLAILMHQVVVVHGAQGNNVCPGNMQLEWQGSAQTVTWTLDGVDPAAVSCTYPSGSSFPRGNTKVDCTYGDRPNEKCQFHVHLRDTNKPEITACSLPANIVFEAKRQDNGKPGAAAAYPEPSARDKFVADNAIVKCNKNNGDVLEGLGVQTIICTSEDKKFDDNNAQSDGGNVGESCQLPLVVVDTTPPAFVPSTCPSDMTVQATTAVPVPTATVTFLRPTAIDAASDPTVFCSVEPGDKVPLGMTTVTCFAVDDAGNKASGCSFKVTVTPPTGSTVNVQFTPSSVPFTTFYATASGGAAVTLPAVTATGVDHVTCAPASGTSTQPVGIYIVVCTAYDSSIVALPLAVLQYPFQVVDVVAPTISCPSDIETTLPENKDSVSVTYTATATDAVDGDLPVDCTYPTGTPFDQGVSWVMCSAKDKSGNTARCTFRVKVSDSRSPKLSNLPASVITIDAQAANIIEDDAGKVSITRGGMATYTAPTAENNDKSTPAPAVVCKPGSGTIFPMGETQVKCEANGNNGVSSYYAFTVKVADKKPPKFTSCPSLAMADGAMGVIEQEATESDGTAIVNFRSKLAARDDEEGTDATIECDKVSNSKFGMGATVVKCWAKDTSGNSNAANGHCTFVVKVFDAPPVPFSCPNDVTAEASELGGHRLTLPKPVFKDTLEGEMKGSCKVKATGVAVTDSFHFNMGATILVCDSGKDRSGNVKACDNEVTINVKDETKPAMVCPGADNDNKVYWEANGPNGHTKNAPFADGNDIADGPLPATSIGCNVLLAGKTEDDLPEALTRGANRDFPMGISTFTCTGKDKAGNAANCKYIAEVADKTPPGLGKCPLAAVADKIMTVEAGSKQGSKVAIDADDSAIDVVSGSVPMVCRKLNDKDERGDVHDLTSHFAIGTTKVLCTATDDVGNEAKCPPFQIKVEHTHGPYVKDTDGECPTFTDDDYFESEGPGGAHLTLAKLAMPPIYDDVDEYRPVYCRDGDTVLEYKENGYLLPPGKKELICGAKDTIDKKFECPPISVQIKDTKPPVLTNCPKDDPADIEAKFLHSGQFIYNVDGGFQVPTKAYDVGFATYYDVTCWDAATKDPITSGVKLPLGKTHVICGATDEAGNSDTCRPFTVTVVDTTPPNTPVCPDNIVREGDGPTTKVDYTIADVSDDVDGPITPDCDINSGHPFKYGTTTITCTVKDAAGNPKPNSGFALPSCTFTITVQDTTPPAVQCPPPSQHEVTGPNGAPVDFEVNKGIDKVFGDRDTICEIQPNAVLPNGLQNFIPGTVLPKGIHKMMCRSKDGATPKPNEGDCDTDIESHDTTAPYWKTEVKDFSITSYGSGKQGSTPMVMLTYTTPIAHDDGDGVDVPVVCTIPPGTFIPSATPPSFQAVQTTVTCTAEDSDHNKATTKFIVTVQPGCRLLNNPDFAYGAPIMMSSAGDWNFVSTSTQMLNVRFDLGNWFGDYDQLFETAPYLEPNPSGCTVSPVTSTPKLIIKSGRRLSGLGAVEELPERPSTAGTGIITLDGNSHEDGTALAASPARKLMQTKQDVPGASSLLSYNGQGYIFSIKMSTLTNVKGNCFNLVMPLKAGLKGGDVCGADLPKIKLAFRA